MQECLQPDSTVSSVAFSHGTNTNVIRKWLPIYRDTPAASLSLLLPLQPAPRRHADDAVLIALRLSDKTITVKWPSSDPVGCARFIRSLTMIRIDATWLSVEPMDMRVGTELRWAAWSQCSVQRNRTALICSPTVEPTG